MTSHMSEKSRLNRMITTITFQSQLRPDLEQDRDMIELDGERVYTAVADVLRRNPHWKQNRSSFKNCVIVKVPMTSSRGTRKVAVKIFKNLSLHVTGCHSTEMMDATVDTICSQLLESLPVQGTLGVGSSKTITMVNYAYSLPGEVQLQTLCDYLRSEHKMLVIFDPSKYAGANIKFPFTTSTSGQTDNGKRQRVESAARGIVHHEAPVLHRAFNPVRASHV